MSFPYYKQFDTMDCGPTCLRMIAKYYGKNYSLETLRQKSQMNRRGVSLLSMSEAAQEIGFRTLGIEATLDDLRQKAPLPCVVHWKRGHFVVVHRIKSGRGAKGATIFVADPGKGKVKYAEAEFTEGWTGGSSVHPPDGRGMALLLEPTHRFYEMDEEAPGKVSIGMLVKYLLAYRKLIAQLMLGLLLGSVLLIVFPFLTQAIVDIGINTQNISFIYMVLLAQLMLFAGRTLIDFIRSWILLHISTRLNVSILSDFLLKLMKLPLSYFDTRQFGDILQRIADHHQIETFLTNTSLQTLFSLFNIVLFGLILAFYKFSIFAIFLLFSLLYVGWVFFFLKQRRALNYKRFDALAKNQSSIIQIINGMQEIKLSNSETTKRWEWERIQARLFHLNARTLSLTQYQQAGAFFINEGKNILITFLSAKAVVEGDISLGAMLAVQYIIGQLNSPIEQLISFVQVFQDASISLERLNDIHQLGDEEPANVPRIDQLPADKSLQLDKVTFKYPGAGIAPVLRGISLCIPEGKVTAIVGMSGSGKTTLLKMLLKFYAPTTGEIRLGETSLGNISHYEWRRNCGVVMQDGFIFSDTVARNIAVGEASPDVHKLLHAVRVANIKSFIESLPLGYNTVIGAEGNGISQGQKQRLLIARAVYKDPAFLFFDEATNALDANNESTIMDNLDAFFRGRTVVVVAHRLSTVKNADQIVVLSNGTISEMGTHYELTALRGQYYQLVKNQLELEA